MHDQGRNDPNAFQMVLQLFCEFGKISLYRTYVAATFFLTDQQPSQRRGAVPNFARSG